MSAVSGLSRRAFLRSTGWLALGVTALAGCRLVPPLPHRKPPTRNDALGWVQLLPDGAIRVSSPRQEMGQGILAGLALIVAEELDVPPSQVQIAPLSTRDMARVRATVGSDSIREFARPMAIAAATLREELAARAARRLSVAKSALRAEGGAFVGNGQRIEYAALAAGQAVLVEPSGEPELRCFSTACKWVGSNPVPPHIEAIVTGAPLYAGDVTLPGMLHGRMIRPPALGARLGRVSLERARQIPGYVASVIDRERELVGVVARDRFSLHDIAGAVDIAWRLPPPFEQEDIDRAIDIDRHLAEGLEHAMVAEPVSPDEPWDVDMRIDVPLAAHGSIEPRCAVARVGQSEIEVWTGTQDPFYVRSVLARLFDRDESAVVVHNHRMGGAFGSRTICTVEQDAALLARAAKAPVKVQWSRPDEFHRGFHRPPSSHRIRARLDGAGQIAAWWHAFASGHVLFTSAALPAWLQAATMLAPDKGVGRGALPPYALPRRRIEHSDVRLPIPTGPWRGLGAAPNTFAVESAVNQLARIARRDPLEFRLAHLGPERAALAACARRAAQLIRWHRPRDPGRGVGIACGRYKDLTDVAVCAEVVVESGAIRVVRMSCAQDCGRVFAPDQVRAQIAGNLLWGVGMALFEGLPVAGGRVAADYFSDSPLPTSLDMPAIDIDLIGADRGEPRGAGEPAIVAAAAAIANAVAGLTGQQPTALPFGRSQP